MKLSHFQLCSTLLEAHVQYVVDDNRLICIKESDKWLNVSVGDLGTDTNPKSIVFSGMLLASEGVSMIGVKYSSCPSG